MFETLQAKDDRTRRNDERARWAVVQQRGKPRFYLACIASFLPLTLILLGKLCLRIFPHSNRLLLVLSVMSLSLLLSLFVTMLLWRRGIRRNQQPS